MRNVALRSIGVPPINLTIILLTLLIPNIAVFIGGLTGSYITYLFWSTLIIASIPFLYRAGIGAIDLYKALSMGLTLVVIFIALGFIWGFNLRINLFRLSPFSILVSLAIFLIEIVGVEVGRSALIGTVRGFWSKMILGTLGGLIFGSTVYVLIDYFLGIAKVPINFLPGLFYSMILSSLHILGGFGVAVAFRLIVDGFSRFSPLFPSTGELGVVWSGFQSIIYYGILLVILYSVQRLKGISKDMFKFGRFMKLRKYIPEIISLLLVVAVLMTLHFKVVPLVVVSGSMRPTYDVGDIVLITVGSISNVKVGDVIAFIFSGKEVVVHRVYEIVQGGFRTKGDAYLKPDPLIVRKEAVIGKVVGSIPKLGWITIVFREGLKYSEEFMVAVFVALTAIMMFLMKLLRRRKFKFKRSGTYW